MNVFWTQGYDGASVQELLDAMGVSRGTMYASFGDKPSLFAACFERYLSTVDAGVKEILRGSGSASEAIRNTLDAIARFVTEGVRRGCFVTNAAIELAPGEPVLHERVRKAIDATQGAYAEAIRRGIAQGEFRPDTDVDVLARFLIATNQGIVVLGKAGASHEELASVVEFACDSLHRGAAVSQVA